MMKTLHGKVRGKTIELEVDLGLVDGQEVKVQVTMLKPKKRLPGLPPGWTPGSTKSTAGLLADLCSSEEDRILEEIYQDRKRETRRDAPE
jgi:hypothetical protein